MTQKEFIEKYKYQSIDGVEFNVEDRMLYHLKLVIYQEMKFLIDYMDSIPAECQYYDVEKILKTYEQKQQTISTGKGN